jgi:stringent starvation protein B
VSTRDEEPLARLQAVLTALLKHQLNESLAKVDAALARWRDEELGPLETHAEVLRHTARAERLGARIAQVDPDNAGSVLRDAFDADLLSREEFEDLAGCPPEDIEPSPALDVDEMELPPKPGFIGELLEDGPVLIHVDARHEGVAVPDRLRDDAKLVLRFGFGLSPAIQDLELDDETISGTLTFGGVPFHCVLPWPSVYAAVSEATQQAMVWPDDVPAEVLHQMSERAADRVRGVAGDQEQTPPADARNGSADGRAEGGPAATHAPTGKQAKQRPTHLKLVE